jgi:hypothetical protein
VFHEKLIRISPALGTRVGYAAAIAEASGPETGISVLDAIKPEGVSNYRPTGQCALTFCSVSVKPVRLQTFMTARSAWPRTLREGVPHPKEGLIFFIEPVEINPPHPSPT